MENVIGTGEGPARALCSQAAASPRPGPASGRQLWAGKREGFPARVSLPPPWGACPGCPGAAGMPSPTAREPGTRPHAPLLLLLPPHFYTSPPHPPGLLGGPT